MASSSSSIPPLSYAVSAPAPGPIRPEFHELAHTTYLVQSSDPSLTDLDMSCYGDRRHRGEILGPITQSLATNTSLTRLNLGDNGLHRMPVSDEAIRTNSTLQDLSLRMSYLRIEAGFIQALAENSVLTRLDLRGNLITPGALSQFALTLRANTILRELNLTSGSGNPAVVHNSSELQPDRDAAVIPLAEALIDNSTLTKLSLGANHIGGGGSAEALGRALRGNCCLVDLDLNLNSFSDVTAEHLVTALYVNTVLQRLDLGRNNLSATFVRNLCQALRHNTTLTDIGLNSQVRSLIGDPHVWRIPYKTTHL